MNSYDADADRLAVHLAGMVTDPEASAVAGSARTVNAARLGLRWWGRQVLADLGPVRDATTPARPGLAELGTDPVGTLHTLLAVDPPRLRLRPDADQAAVGAADERWTRLGQLTLRLPLPDHQLPRHRPGETQPLPPPPCAQADRPTRR